MNAGSIPARTSTVLVADVPLAAPPRRSRRDRAAWLALALLLHFLVFAALVLVLPEEPKPPDTPAPAEVALLFEGGSSPAKPAPPSERVAPSKAPAPIPGLDAETTSAGPPPPPAAAPAPETASRTAPEAATPPAPPSIAPPMPAAPPAAPPSPSASPSASPTSPPPAPPDIAGTVPVPPPVVRPPAETATATPEPPSPATPPPPPPALASREPPRPRPPRVALRPSQPRVASNGFPTTLMPSFDLSQRSSVSRNAALPPPSAAHGGFTSDVRGGEALGADWLAELSAYVERHKRYPEQAAQNDEEGDSTISIVVGRDGRVFGRDVDLVRRSGSQFLDMGLMSMFRDKQLPPFPPGAPHDRETIQITMHYYLIR